MLVIMGNLSENALNGKYYHVVKVFPEEEKLLIDVTPTDWPATQVRYVKVSSSKVCAMHQRQSRDGVNVHAVLLATNRDRAFAAAGFDPTTLECLAVRPHPEVQHGRLWRDMKPICTKRNRDNAPGAPFTLEFGFQIFGDGGRNCLSNPTFETCYSSEPYLILRDCRGNGIDVAPDIECDPMKRAYHKLFMPDRHFDQQKWYNMFDVVVQYVEYGWMPTAPHMEEPYQRMTGVCNDADPYLRDNAVNLGMLRGDLNMSWPNPKS